LRRVEIADFGDGVEHVGEGACADPPEVGLELGACHFDRVKVETAWGRPAPGVTHGSGRFGIHMSGEVVANDYSTCRAVRHQHHFDVSDEDGALPHFESVSMSWLCSGIGLLLTLGDTSAG